MGLTASDLDLYSQAHISIFYFLFFSSQFITISIIIIIIIIIIIVIIIVIIIIITFIMIILCFIKLFTPPCKTYTKTPIRIWPSAFCALVFQRNCHIHLTNTSFNWTAKQINYTKAK